MTAATDESAKPPPTTVTNQSRHWVRIIGASGTLLLSPLGQRRLDADHRQRFDLDALRSSPHLRVQSETKSLGDKFIESAVQIAAMGVPLAVIIWGIAAEALRNQSVPPAVVITSFTVLVIAAFAVLTYTDWTASRWLQHQLAMVVCLLIAFGLPVLALDFSPLQPHFAPGGVGLLSPSLRPLTLALTLRIVFVGLAALVPAGLYFLFDRERLATLRERFVRTMFRLDGTIETVDELEDKYGNRMLETFGRPTSHRGRLVAGTRFPIIFATLLIALGFTFSLLGSDANLDQPAGVQLFLESMTPRPTATVFGFLGAYIFSLNTTIRAYLRGDLRPKTYGNVAARIIVVVLICGALSELDTDADSGVILAAAFTAGVFPEVALRWITDQGRLYFGRSRSPGLYEPLPLTLIEGIDTYDQARLQDEGINNVEALAHCDLIDLLLSTRIPPPRILDWVDQAILVIHANPRSTRNGDANRPSVMLERLRSTGIRTATDLLAAVPTLSNLGDQADDEDEPTTEQRSRAALAGSLRNQEWIRELGRWRTNDEPTRGDAVDIHAVASSVGATDAL